MSDIRRLMGMLQFGDSMLPVGAFSFSNGLESAIAQEFVHDLETLRAFVLTAAQQAAASDGIGVLAAHRAALGGDLDRIVVVDQTIFNRKLNEEMRTMSTRMGRKLAEMSGQVQPAPLMVEWLGRIKSASTPGTYPVGQALVFAGLNLSEQEAFAVHQYGVASMMLGAALRLMKVSYLDAQAILFEINTAAEAAYARAAEASLDDMATFAPVSDILAAVHVGAHVRMFMN